MHPSFEVYVSQVSLFTFSCCCRYVYNRRAIQQSHDLCRVYASHKAVMNNPKPQLDRIYNELRACGVAVPRQVSEADINTFIDVKLQHGHASIEDNSCSRDIETLMPPSTWPTTDQNDLRIFRIAMRAFCAMQSGDAFSPSFAWDETITDA